VKFLCLVFEGEKTLDDLSRTEWRGELHAVDERIADLTTTENARYGSRRRKA